MSLMRYIILGLFISAHFITYSQNGVENQIQEIRKRYYYVNGGKVHLAKHSIKEYDYYFENGKLRKVIYKTDEYNYEYYFDEEFIKDYAYFIYTIDCTNGGKDDNRFYFGNKERLIRWLDPQKREVGRNSDIFCQKNFELIAKAADILTILNNERNDDARPKFSVMTRAIDEVIEAKSKLTLTVDTVSVEDIPEESYFSHEIAYRDGEGKLVKTLDYQGGDHGSSTTTTFYDDSENKILVLEEEGTIYSPDTINKHYYKSTRKFRTVIIKSVDREWEGCGSFKYVYLPRIEDRH